MLSQKNGCPALLALFARGRGFMQIAASNHRMHVAGGWPTFTWLAHLNVLCKGGDSCCRRGDFDLGLTPLIDSHRTLCPEGIAPITAPRPLLRFPH